MALVTVEGIYEDGKIELCENPEGVTRSRVMVTFLPNMEASIDMADEDARQRAFALMKSGISFGAEKFNRKEIYEERMRELEARQDRNR